MHPLPRGTAKPLWLAKFVFVDLRDPRERPCSSVMHSLPRGAIPPGRLDSLRERRAPSASKRESRLIAKPLWHADLCRAPEWSARAIPKVHGSKKTLSSNTARAPARNARLLQTCKGAPPQKGHFPGFPHPRAAKNLKLSQNTTVSLPKSPCFLRFHARVRRKT